MLASAVAPENSPPERINRELSSRITQTSLPLNRLVCQSRWTAVRLCFRSYLINGFLRALLLLIVLIAQAILKKDSVDSVMGYMRAIFKLNYYIGSAEGHEYPNLQVGDEVDPRLSFCVNSKSIDSCFF